MSDELKPCPFCGGDWIAPAALSDGNWYLCEDCGASSGSDGIDGWNARPIEDGLRARAEAAEAELAALKAANEWTNVEDGYPEKEYKDLGDEVLVELDYPRVIPMRFMYINGVPEFYTDVNGWTHDWTNHVRRWRYLPEPPEVSE